MTSVQDLHRNTQLPGQTPDLAEIVWSDALTALAVNDATRCTEEINDVCLLLMLAERVFVVASDRDHTAVRFLTCCLRQLGVPILFLGTAGSAIRPTDTVIVISGPGDETTLSTAVQPALDSRAVLILVTTETTSQRLIPADAVIRLPEMASGNVEPMNRRRAKATFDLNTVICADAIARNLNERYRRRA